MTTADRLLQLALLLLLLLQLPLGPPGLLPVLVPVLLLLLWARPLPPRLAPLPVLPWLLLFPWGERDRWLAAAVLGLLLLAGLQWLEARQEGVGPDRRRRTVLLLLVLTALQGVLAPDLLPALGQILVVLLALAALVAGEAVPPLRARRLAWTALLLPAAALPLVLTLFLLLPRLPPLWSLPAASGSAVTGLSERLEPGSLARLVRSDALALRVLLPGAPPPPQERYWRVLVQDRSDGRSWWAAPEAPLLPPRPRSRGSNDGQLWISEPSDLTALPWAGAGNPSPTALRIDARGRLQTPPGSGSQRWRYRLTDAAGDGDGGGWQRIPPDRDDRDLPAAVNPRLQALGRTWAHLEPARRPEAARRWFQEQGFRYSLEPGPLDPRNPLDDFLFERRVGFCEHHAAAFTALMRAAGLSARVVSGYQGGEWFPSAGGGGVLEVRQRDAHAWSEVWLPGAGWQRFDPTAWVAPTRLEAGLEAQLDPEERRRLRALPGWWRQLARGWSRLDMAWARWVTGFDAGDQRRLLAGLPGHGSRWQGLLGLGAMGLAVGLGGLVIRIGMPRSTSADPLRRQLDRSLRRCARRGLGPGPGEGLRHWRQRVSAARPDLRGLLLRIEGLYDHLRFAPQVPPPPVARRLRRIDRRLARRLRRPGRD